MTPRTTASISSITTFTAVGKKFISPWRSLVALHFTFRDQDAAPINHELAPSNLSAPSTLAALFGTCPEKLPHHTHKVGAVNMTMDPTLPRGGSGLDTLRLCIKDFLATRRLNWLKKEDTMVKTDQSPLLADSTMVYDSIGNLAQGGQAREWTASAGQTASTWQTEAKVLGTCSRSLALTLILQQSLTVASVFTVGHIGTVELGAVSLATMTANITGYAVYEGLATSLDTLAAQAYGSGMKELVGLQTQRMLYFLWVITIPIAAVWACGTKILEVVVPEGDTAALAGLYLKVLIAGAPGYAAFESGKRFVQAQGLFHATLYCTLICAPLNAVMNYVFVWQLEWGFVGAPIAVAITQNLHPVFLIGYVYLVPGRDCWNGLDSRALHNWCPMIKLAIPGLITVLAQFLAFEILTLAAARLGLTALAAQSILATVTTTTWQIPFAIGVSASTRIANLIGAQQPEAAKLAAKVDIIVAILIGVLYALLLSSLHNVIPNLLTNDSLVSTAVSEAMPVCAAAQLFDALATNCNSILRGLGKQEIGGYIGLVAFYAIALPLSFWTAFGLNWNLQGLWAGPIVGLGTVSLAGGYFICVTSWEKAVADAEETNMSQA